MGGPEELRKQTPPKEAPVTPQPTKAPTGLPKADTLFASKEKLEPRDVISRNAEIWQKYYKGGRQRDALSKIVDLYEVAERSGVRPEILADILATKSWSEYSLDMMERTGSNRAYLSANEGLSKIEGMEGRAVSIVRSRLLQVAGLTQAYLAIESDQPARPMLEQSVEEAEKSEDRERIGEAKNGYALWFISNIQKDKDGKIPEANLKEAISQFKEVVDIQREAGNKKGEFNALSNLSKSYYETGQFEKSIKAADEATKVDDRKDLGITLSIYFRKSLPYEGLGMFDEAEEIFRDNIKRITAFEGLSDEERVKKIQQQEQNIKNMRERQKALGKKE